MYMIVLEWKVIADQWQVYPRTESISNIDILCVANHDVLI